MTIGSNIRNIRRNHKLTQEQFAEEIYCSAQSVSKWERDLITPNLDVIKTISSKFNVSMSYVLLNDNEINFEKTVLDTSILLLKENIIPSIEIIAKRTALSEHSLHTFFKNDNDLIVFIIKKFDVNMKKKLILNIDNNNVIYTFIDKCLPIIRMNKDILQPMYSDTNTSAIIIQYLKNTYSNLLKHHLNIHDELKVKIIVSNCIEIINAALTYYSEYSISDIKKTFSSAISDI
ncbi:helix-turn-helix domain-containing protein [Apilactobacillus sp. TMW 2.2459]|uniref:helix-turn-helix domain-containing protein n=1 Tax=Apilactobacillus xinyiensis TaxID=2841032 RepID=UPI002010315D|nr:helix-turn-helix transcriptional regulator [Apilactobacillus xinyiensis]MCL0312150.1 helix-turn-helix domain-containing protein [Apilactobacillus xinyiensis]